MPLPQPNRYIRLFFYFYIALLIIQGCHILIGLFTADPALINEFYQFGISDWLINYESGFVRRGLVGQLLLSLYNTCPFDIGIAIIATTYISIILLSAVVIYMFYKHKTSMFILPTAFALGGFFLIKATFYRRDALMLLAIFLTLYLHRQYLTTSIKRRWLLLATYISGIVSLLIHEAAFFCFVPFLFIHYYTTHQGAIATRIGKSAIFTLPYIVTFILSCTCKGNIEMGNTIWYSWSDFFYARYGTQLPMGVGIEALSWDTIGTFKRHFTINYGGAIEWNIPYMSFLDIQFPRAIAWIAIYIVIYYLCANSNKIRLHEREYDNKHNPINAYQPTILLMQFVALLPMFTLLSCDLRRVIIYWILTSFFISYQLVALGGSLSIPLLSTASSRIVQFFNNNRITSSKWFYLLCTLFVGVPACQFTIYDYTFSTEIFNTLRFIFHAIQQA